MNKQIFESIINRFYLPILTDAGFSNPAIKISGRLYRASFLSDEHKVDVCYEPGDDFVCIYIFSREGNDWSDIDNLKVTPRLSELNKRYMHEVTPHEMSKANEIFDAANHDEEISRKLIKFARDLYLVLPRYLQGEIRATH